MRHDDRCDLWPSRQEIGRKFNLVLAEPFRVQSRLRDSKGPVLLHLHVVIGARLDAFEHQKRLAYLDKITITNMQGTDDASFEMLHRPAASIWTDHSRRDCSARQGDKGGPAARIPRRI